MATLPHGTDTFLFTDIEGPVARGARRFEWAPGRRLTIDEAVDLALAPVET